MNNTKTYPLHLSLSSFVMLYCNAQVPTGYTKSHCPTCFQSKKEDIATSSTTAQSSSKKAPSQTFYGPATINNQTFAHLAVYGPATLTNAHILQSLEICGVASIHNSTIDSAQINGPFDATGTTIKKELDVNGPVTINQGTINALQVNGVIKATGSTIETIDAHTQSIQLTNSTINGDIIITDEGHGSSKKDSELVLDGTTVKGNITFAQRKGVIVLRNNAKIEGTITGEKKASKSPAQKKH